MKNANLWVRIFFVASRLFVAIGASASVFLFAHARTGEPIH